MKIISRTGTALLVVCFIIAGCKHVSPPTPTASFSITVEGVGKEEIRRTGGGKCTTDLPVRVDVSIAGGAPGNTIQGKATCLGAVVAMTNPTADTGGAAAAGFGVGTQIAGQAGCKPTYIPIAAPDSNWLVLCQF